jgi:hypothetical protein
MFKKRSGFFDSDEGKAIRQKLQYMTTDKSFNTLSSYTSDSSLYPDSQMPFVDKHMNYLNSHPELDSQMYIANVRLKTRIR